MPENYKPGRSFKSDAMTLVKNGVLPVHFLPLLTTIYELSKGSSGCYASKRYLAKELGKTERQIQTQMRVLAHLRFIVPCGSFRVNFTDRKMWKTSWSYGVGFLGHSFSENLFSREKSDSPYLDRIGDIRSISPHLSLSPSGGAEKDEKIKDRKETTMPLLPEDQIPRKEKTTTKPPRQEDLDRAQMLRKAVIEKTGIIRPWKKSNWAREFRKLSDQLGNEHRLLQTLVFYCEHMTDSEFYPVARCGKSFRKKFEGIENARKKYEKDNPPPVELDKTGKLLLTNLKHLNWPKGSKTKLPRFIHTTLTNYQNFLVKVKRLRETGVKDRMLSKFLLHLKGALPSDYTFVETWARQVQKDVENWESWSGRLLSLAFDGANGGQFADMGAQIASQFSGSVDLWEKLWSAFNDEE